MLHAGVLEGPGVAAAPVPAVSERLQALVQDDRPQLSALERGFRGPPGRVWEGERLRLRGPLQNPEHAPVQPDARDHRPGLGLAVLPVDPVSDHVFLPCLSVLVLFRTLVPDDHIRPVWAPVRAALAVPAALGPFCLRHLGRSFCRLV